MAIFASTGGSAEGCKLFHEWSSKSGKYDEASTNKKWADLHSCPPTDIGVGMIFAQAGQISRLEYERIRTEVANNLGIRVAVLDEFVEKLRPKDEEEDEDLQGTRLELPDTEPWHAPVDGLKLVKDIRESIKAHIIMTDHQTLAVTLWVFHTHLLDLAEHSARLHISSPTKRCGKTVLMSITKCFVPRALTTESISTAALFRVIELAKPTLLIDEVDTFLNGENREDLRGLLNAGHNPGGGVLRVVGEKMEVRKFKVFTPVVLSGIGEIPETLEDRSITINLRRKLPDEKVERFTREKVAKMENLGRQIARWASDNRGSLNPDPMLPEELNDRAMDNWRQIIAIADLIGTDLGKEARLAAAMISKEDVSVKEERAIELLADCAEITKSGDKTGQAIINELTDMEDRPWKEFTRDRKPITKNMLTRMLKKFNVRPKHFEVNRLDKDGHVMLDKDDKPLKITVKKFVAAQISEACDRYVDNKPEPAERDPF